MRTLFAWISACRALTPNAEIFLILRHLGLRNRGQRSLERYARGEGYEAKKTDRRYVGDKWRRVSTRRFPRVHKTKTAQRSGFHVREKTSSGLSPDRSVRSFDPYHRAKSITALTTSRWLLRYAHERTVSDALFRPELQHSLFLPGVSGM